jgi:hypothetical protein
LAIVDSLGSNLPVDDVEAKTVSGPLHLGNPVHSGIGKCSLSIWTD